MDDFSVTPEVGELIVPAELFSVRFETDKNISGVRLLLSPVDQNLSILTATIAGGLCYIGGGSTLVYAREGHG